MVKAEKKYLIRGHDFKALQWKQHASTANIRLVKGSRLTFGLKVIRNTLSAKNGEVVVVQRYLNDYKSLGKSLLLLITDVLYIFYLKIRRFDLVWICHNLDKESHCHHAKLLSLRRSLLLKNCRQILVTDPLFVKYGKLLFRKYEVPVDALTFGAYENRMAIHKQEHEQSEKLNGPHSYSSISTTDFYALLDGPFADKEFLGYCGGSPLPKKKYMAAIPELIGTAEKQGIDLKLIVISDLRRAGNPELYDFLVNSEKVLFINSLMSIDLFRLAGFIDFYWTGYEDISIPYSIYSAATTEVPLLSMPIGILPILLNHYETGLTLNSKFDNLSEKLRALKNTSFRFNEFTETHTWKSLELKLTQDSIG